MDPKINITDIPNMRYTKCVYFNPNFKIESASRSNRDFSLTNQNINMLHINPDFKRQVVIQNNNNSNDHLKQVSNGKIHINPKMLANMKNNAESYMSCANNITTVAINKFCKINPPMEEKKSIECSKILPIPRARKPCHSLIRNSSVNNKTSDSTLVPNRHEIKNVKPYESFPAKNLISDTHTKEKTKINYKIVNKPYPKKMIKMKKLNEKKAPSLSSRIIIIGGEKYLNANTKLLKISKMFKSKNSTKVIRCISIEGKKFIRKSDNVFELDKSAKVSRKVNVTCPIYRRLGLCIRHKNGKCPLLHDPKCVAICKKFLQGDCQIDGCNLSHTVIVEKMPTCRYFLEGCCSRVDCPYLHVKINENANVCERFLQGYCADGKNCGNLHIDVCPTYYKSKKCDKSKCPHPHKIVTIKRLDSSTPSKCDKNTRVPSSKTLESSSSETASRYFVDNDCAENDLQKADDDENKIVVAFKDRPRVGSLPSFISI